MTRTRATLFAALLCATPLAQGAAPAIPDSLRACSRLQDSLQRLVCYDREIAAQPAATSPVARPTLGEELVPAKARPAGGQVETSLTAVVAGLRELPQGTYAITLDNGQLWRQTEKARYFPLNVGETVRIDRGILGSYQLTRIVEGSSRFVRVTRVK